MTDIKDVLLADQLKGQADNTAARKALKENLLNSWGVRIAILIAILSIFFFLAIAGSWNFFWLLAVSAGVWYAGSKLAGLKDAKAVLWHWPVVLKGLAIAIALGTIGTSGFVKLLAVGANNLETAVDCYAEPNQVKCEDAADEEETYEVETTAVPAVPAGAMEMVNVPFCNGNKTWSAKIPLHGSRWQMTPAWSASTTTMSFLIDGKWSKATSSALSGASHIRYCTVSNELAGESMPLNWKWLGN